MQIRHPKSTDEVLAQADVAEAAFGAHALPEPWRDRYAMLEQRFGRDAFLALEVDGRFVSSCTCLPASVWVGERRLTLGAVGGVATLPECRRHGYAGAVMRAVIEQMQAQGLVTSALWPFSYPYYRKFGWDYGCEHRLYRFEPAKIGPLPEPEGVTPFTLDDLPGVIAAFTTFGRGLAFCTDRSEAWWRELLRLHGVPPVVPDEQSRYRMIVCREEDRVAGYAIYRPMDDERRLGIQEMVALSSTARLRLVAALAREEPSTIAFRAPANDRFRSQVPDPRQVHVSLEPGFSFRVVDPLAALAVLTPPAGVSGEITFSLHDPARPQRPLEVVVAVERGSLETRAGARSGLRFATDIATFSQLFSGYLCPHAARWLGRVEADAASLDFAAALFPRWTAYRSALEPG